MSYLGTMSPFAFLAGYLFVLQFEIQGTASNTPFICYPLPGPSQPVKQIPLNLPSIGKYPQAPPRFEQYPPVPPPMVQYPPVPPHFEQYPAPPLKDSAWFLPPPPPSPKVQQYDNYAQYYPMAGDRVSDNKREDNINKQKEKENIESMRLNVPSAPVGGGNFNLVDDD